MIISHQHKYLFIEIPQTGSTAISQELCSHYGGERILKKHSCYTQFLAQATREEKQYFTFATVRNPLEIVVSKYLKARYDHGDKYSPQGREGHSTFVDRNARVKKEYEFINGNQASFEEYFLQFFPRIYNSRATLLPADLGMLLRFETLQDDFLQLLTRLGIEPVGPLPVVNKTQTGGKSFFEYYSPTIRPHAFKIFGPYLTRWGYSFPDPWGEPAVPITSEFRFMLDGILRNFYYRFLHLRGS